MSLYAFQVQWDDLNRYLGPKIANKPRQRFIEVNRLTAQILKQRGFADPYELVEIDYSKYKIDSEKKRIIQAWK